MRLVSIVTSAVIAAATFATQAEAGASIAYIGLRGSVIDTNDGDTTSGVINFEEHYENGYGLAAFLGWVLDDNFRLELEAGYRAADLSSAYITRNDFDPLTVGHTFDVGGHAETGTFMTNLYYDIHFLGDIGVLPWVAAGVGGTYIDYNIDQPTIALGAKDDTWAFSYQFMAGITVPLGDSISGSIAYRWFQTEDFTYYDSFGLGFQTQLTQQSIDFGVQFHL